MHPFFNSSDPHGNVVFWSGSDAIGALSVYAHGYHEAGRALARRMRRSAGYADYHGYPMLFLYRHALELYLKAIVLRGAELAGLLSPDKPSVNLNGVLRCHRLSWFIPRLEAVFRGIGWEWETDVPGARSFEEFKELVEEIDRLDGDSYCFRYPVNTLGASNLPRDLIINVLKFARSMDPVLDLLDGGVVGIEHRFDRRAEVESLLQDLLQDPSPDNGE